MPGLQRRHDYRCLTVSDYFSVLAIVVYLRFHEDVNKYRITLCDIVKSAFFALHTIELDASRGQGENTPEKPCCQLTRGSPGRLPLPGRQVVDPALAVLSGGRYLPAGAGPAAATEDSHAGWTAGQMPDGGPWH